MGIMSLSQKEVINALRKGKVTICVVGLGRIGLPQAALFADRGAHVIGADVDPAVVECVNSGRSHLLDEPGLDRLVMSATNSGRLKATVDTSLGVEAADFVIVSVPTPISAKRIPDYSQMEEACHAIAKTLPKDCLIIIESTVGPGAVEDFVIPLLEEEAKMEVCVDFGVASCPERADPGGLLRDLTTVPRIVGGINDKSAEIARALYREIFGVEVVVVSDPKTANAAKLAENLFRDVNIALVSEFALLYEKLGIDAIEVIDACSTKYNFMPHYPSAGVGGPCLPQNPYFLIYEGMKAGYIPRMVQMARQINDDTPKRAVAMATMALRRINKKAESSKIAILGVTYKPNIRDLQHTPVEKIFISLKEIGATLKLYDPMFRDEEVFGKRISRSVEEAVRDADCILIGTAHDEFRNLDLDLLRERCNMPAVFADIANISDPSIVEEHGFTYAGIRKPEKSWSLREEEDSLQCTASQ
ncbi:MAG: nucleotide sugar dehydrogenase [Candidatus Bathyarchaeota archaeon]|nr:MAG: nucleotide sugar dehydrogenase [Candidatus Bathyarchaeota archaeon]